MQVICKYYVVTKIRDLSIQKDPGTNPLSNSDLTDQVALSLISVAAFYFLSQFHDHLDP